MLLFITCESYCIAVEWLELEDKGQINQVNVNFLGNLSSAVEGTEFFEIRKVQFLSLPGEDH